LVREVLSVRQLASVSLILVLGLPTAAPAADDFDRPPISYRDRAPDNPVSRLQERLDAGAVRLEHDERLGYLPAVLQQLDVPVSSQALVFSKTSLQQRLIGPQNPRALYFNDEVYVGYVRGGEVVEVSVADPQLGTVFYTLAQDAHERPTMVRQTDDCLICHGGSQTSGVPGHVIRSVYADASGQPIFSAGSHRVDQTTPLIRRFGGWFVTGSHGPQQHLGNVTFRRRPDHDGVDDESGLNVKNVAERFGTDGYLSPHSDLVAQLVLAHQAAAHNAITKAGFAARSALHREAALNRELGEAPDHRWPSTTTVLDAAVDDLLECFLMADEPPLAAPVAGTSAFAAEFVTRGPAAPDGRSLRELDLERRLFRHPCSFLVYSPSFAALPPEVRTRFWDRLSGILAGSADDPRFAHLSPDDRAAIREILAATHPAAPPAWRAGPPAQAPAP
jgi:hypothetical protein